MRTSFYQRPDWLSFGMTATTVLIVYLFTLSPEVTLEWSGIFSTGAMYGGVSPPPGFPLWNFYAWCFIKLLPFSNIAWRIAVSSAVAGAFACGLIALMVSRGSLMMLAGMAGFERLPEKDERRLRMVCGFVAGTAFAFHGVFWGEAIIVEVTALNMAMFSLVLCFLLRWVHEPEKVRYLYAAFFAYGLTLSVSLSLIVAAPGLPFIVLFRKPSLGRDLFFAMAAMIVLVLLANRLNVLPDGFARVIHFADLAQIFFVIGIIATLLAIGIGLATRRSPTELKTICAGGAFLLPGLSLYLCLPIVSMTNPPGNWAYARTVEGFVHLVSRGQFERWNPTTDLGRLVEQLKLYAGETESDLGFIYLLLALIPFCFLRKMRMPERGWMLGLAATFLSLSLFMVAMLNPSPDRQTLALASLHFPASHLVLTIWAGFGLALLGTMVGRVENEINVKILCDFENGGGL